MLTWEACIWTRVDLRDIIASFSFMTLCKAASPIALECLWHNCCLIHEHPWVGRSDFGPKSSDAEAYNSDAGASYDLMLMARVILLPKR